MEHIVERHIVERLIVERLIVVERHIVLIVERLTSREAHCREAPHCRAH